MASTLDASVVESLIRSWRSKAYQYRDEMATGDVAQWAFIRASELALCAYDLACAADLRAVYGAIGCPKCGLPFAGKRPRCDACSPGWKRD